jgi:hypothetical protein
MTSTLCRTKRHFLQIEYIFETWRSEENVTRDKRLPLRKGRAHTFMLETRWKEPVLLKPIFGYHCTVTSTSQINSVCTPIIHVSYTASSGNGLDVYPRNTPFEAPSKHVLYKPMLLLVFLRLCGRVSTQQLERTTYICLLLILMRNFKLYKPKDSFEL